MAKIAVIAPTALPAQRANTVQVMKMTQALVALGQDARLVFPADPGVSPGVEWGDLEEFYGLAYKFAVQGLRVAPRFRRYDYGWSAVRWAHSWGAELIYTRLPQAAAIASLLNYAVILEVHDYPQGRMGPVLMRAFLAGAGARGLVFISHALHRAVQEHFSLSKYHLTSLVAPDGVDLARYQHLTTPSDARRLLSASHNLSLAEGFLAGYTGSMYPGRGVELILAVARHMPKINFLLVGGSANDRKRLQRQAQTYALENIIFAGYVSNADLPLYQAACDVLLMPYQEEVTASSGGNIAAYLSPMKLFEYMASGRAILSSNLPVLREVLNRHNALLLPPDDVRAWCAALQSLLDDPEQRAVLSSQARWDVAEYTWEKRAGRILSGLAV